LSRVAMMQVIEADTHDNYVVCRGFDPETNKLHERLCVAKPYSVRGTTPYVIGQVFAAMKARTRLGDNPGVASESTGQPADLDEVIDLLTDDDNSPIYWIELGGGASSNVMFGKLDGALSQGDSATMSIWGFDPSDGSFADTTENITVYDWLMKSGSADIASGKKLVVLKFGDVGVVLEAECPG
jgi:hypothetical protein